MRKYLSIIMALIFAFLAVGPVFASSGGHGGAVFVMNNAADGNQILIYDRAADGNISFVGQTATGGLGSGVGVTVPPDPLGSQNSVMLSPDGRWLFAVNAGSNDISVFKVRGDSLTLTDKVGSGGAYPVSLTFRNGFLYVLNAAGEGNITGFFQLPNGRLVPLKGSTRSLHASTPADGSQPQILESPSQVGFSPDGRYLVVVDKGGVSGQGRILVFKLIEGLIPALQPEVTQTANPVPFSFVFDRFGHLVVVDASAGSITTYMISGKGSLTTLASVTNGQAAVCWIATNGAYTFTDNTGSGTISSLKTDRNGGLNLLNAAAANTGAGTLPLDMNISADGRFLYTLETGAGAIGIYQIQADGSLSLVGTMTGLPPVGGTQGIAVW